VVFDVRENMSVVLIMFLGKNSRFGRWKEDGRGQGQLSHSVNINHQSKGDEAWLQ